jgi:hypothetical protein
VLLFSRISQICGPFNTRSICSSFMNLGSSRRAREWQFSNAAEEAEEAMQPERR